MQSKRLRGWRRRAANIGEWIARAFARRVSVDLRALAAFRIAIGGLIVLDLLLRARDFTAFYTDDGVLPTRALFSDYSDVNSLHASLGDPLLVGLLFVIAALFGVLLMLGYRTRTVTVVSWLLLFSLQNRNPMILNGGDVLFRMLLFWSMFLPLGARWSIDARRREDWDVTDRDTVATMASAAILAQVALVYVSNFVHKTRGEEWLSGKAVPYIMTLDQFTVLLGPTLARFPDLLVFTTYFWLFLMAMSPFLFLLTGWPRALLATGFMGMHIGMAFTMQIGIFPLVAVAGLSLFYQSVVWDTVERITDFPGRLERVRRHFPRRDSPSEFLAALPRVPYPSEIPGVRVTLSTVIPTVFLVLVLIFNAHALGYAEPPPERGQELLDTTDTEQTWQLFAPTPLKDTRWFVANATLENGEHVDAVTGGNVTFDRPPDPADRAGNARWRKYLSNVYGASNDDHRSYLANYLCERWNRSHRTKMESVEINVLTQRGTPYGGERPVQESSLIEYDCSGPFDQS